MGGSAEHRPPMLAGIPVELRRLRPIIGKPRQALADYLPKSIAKRHPKKIRKRGAKIRCDQV